MRVVVLRALGLGDLLTGVPALRAVRRALPDARVELLAPVVFAPLLGDVVDEVVDTPPFVLAPLDHVAEGSDLAINLHGRGPQSTAALRELAPARLVAFGIDAEWRDDEHEVARWCRLLREGGVAPDADPSELRLPPPAQPAAYDKVVVVHPGAASEGRRWPAERFAAVAAALKADGHEIVVTGSAAERELAERVARLAHLPPSSVLAGRTTLVELAAVVASARLVICGDTGVAHLATAYGTRSVVLFGPTPPALWGPPNEDGRHRVLWAGTTGDPHGTTVDAGLLAIDVAAVLAATREILRA